MDEQNNDGEATRVITIIGDGWYRDSLPEDVAQLAALANEALLPQQAARLGTLSVAPMRHGDEIMSRPFIRSEPLREFGGGEFMFSGGSIAPGVPVDVLVDGLREAAGRVLSTRDAVAATVAQTRAMAEAALARHPGVEPPAVVAAMGVMAHPSMIEPKPAVRLELLGQDLAMGQETIRASAHVDLEEEIARALDEHARLAAILAHARKEGVRGWIDATAAALLASSGLPLAYALDHLADAGKLDFSYDGIEVARLAWEEGVLVGGFRDTAGGASLFGGRLHVSARLPETVLTSVAGCPVGRVVDHPLVPGDAIILSTEQTEGPIELRLEIPIEPLPALEVPT